MADNYFEFSSLISFHFSGARVLVIQAISKINIYFILKENDEITSTNKNKGSKQHRRETRRSEKNRRSRNAAGEA